MTSSKTSKLPPSAKYLLILKIKRPELPQEQCYLQHSVFSISYASVGIISKLSAVSVEPMQLRIVSLVA